MEVRWRKSLGFMVCTCISAFIGSEVLSMGKE
jgi:hypothetical protein